MSKNAFVRWIAALAVAVVTMCGTVTAGAGAIGGFDLGTDYLRDAGNSFGLASTVTGGDDVRFWAGAAFASRGTAPFRLTESGALVATSATISGDITATSGDLGDLDVSGTLTIGSGGELVAGAVVLTNGGLSLDGGNITMSASGLAIASGVGTGSARITLNGFALWGASGGVFVGADLSVAGNILATESDSLIQGHTIEPTHELLFVNIPSGTGTTVIWDSGDGQLKKDSSSLRYKENVKVWNPQS